MTVQSQGYQDPLTKTSATCPRQKVIVLQKLAFYTVLIKLPNEEIMRDFSSNLQFSYFSVEGSECSLFRCV